VRVSVPETTPGNEKKPEIGVHVYVVILLNENI
jgi:hypothetical protein